MKDNINDNPVFKVIILINAVVALFVIAVIGLITGKLVPFITVLTIPISIIFTLGLVFNIKDKLAFLLINKKLVKLKLIKDEFLGVHIEDESIVTSKLTSLVIIILPASLIYRLLNDESVLYNPNSMSQYIFISLTIMLSIGIFILITSVKVEIKANIIWELTLFGFIKIRKNFKLEDFYLFEKIDTKAKEYTFILISPNHFFNITLFEAKTDKEYYKYKELLQENYSLRVLIS